MTESVSGKAQIYNESQANPEMPNDEIAKMLGWTISVLNPRKKDIFKSINDEALDFWNRAAGTIADLNNPILRGVLLSESTKTVIAICKEQKSNIPGIALSNERRLENLTPEKTELLIENFAFLSKPEIISEPLANNKLWHSLPEIAALNKDSVGVIVSEQLKRMQDASELITDTQASLSK